MDVTRSRSRHPQPNGEEYPCHLSTSFLSLMGKTSPQSVGALSPVFPTGRLSLSRWHLRPSYFGGSTLEGLGVCFAAPPRHSLQADVHILTGERGPARLQWYAARQTAQPDATSILGAWHQANAEGGRVPPQGHHTPLREWFSLPLTQGNGRTMACPSFCQLVVTEGAQRRALDIFHFFGHGRNTMPRSSDIRS